MRTPRTKIRTKKDDNNNNNNQKLQIPLLHFRNENSYVICNHTHLLPNFLPLMQCSPKYRKDIITAAEATATKRDWQLQNSSPTAEFFPHRDNRLRKQNPSKKKNKGPGSAWKILPGTTRTDRQIDTIVALIYKIDLKPPFWGY
jgi:hypothetical protein